MGLSYISFKKKKIQTPLNQMTIIYKINPKNPRIKLFGHKFVENNKNKCKIIINDKLQDIIEHFTITDQIQYNNNELIIKLIETSKIIKMNSIFSDCKSLISLPDISDWDFKDVIDMSTMFSYCENLTSLPDISNWDTSQVINMSALFSHCIS